MRKAFLALVCVLSLAVFGCSPAAPPTPTPASTKPEAVPTTAAPAPTTAAAAATAGPTADSVPNKANAPAKPSNSDLILATTTSTQDSGLLDVLVPMFEKATGYKVKTIAVGSGQAMTMGQRGEADVLLVHAPDSEKKFMADGFGVNRQLVMHNDFVIVGVPDDPAKLKGTKTAVDAFKKLAEAKVLFISRGDNSGTYQWEAKLWKSTGIDPKGQSWYQETGQGMGATLNVGAEKKGYVLTDRGTYLALKSKLGLDILVEGDQALLNIYHAMQVNPARFPEVNADGGRAFVEFMVSKEAQSTIEKFGVDRFGQPLFFPDAGKPDPTA